MNEQYKWNYDIKIKTKEGTFEYEQETLLQATHKQKKLVKGVNNGRTIKTNNKLLWNNETIKIHT